MTHQQILEKAISKAIDGGWVLGKDPTVENIKSATAYLAQGNFPLVIFHHDFAKALWGNGGIISFADPMVAVDWKMHLQRMVVAKDPIAYLGRNI